MASRTVDTFLQSPTTPPKVLKAFLLGLRGKYHTLADDRIGSRVVGNCFARADGFLKVKIAESLKDQLNFLQASHYGHHIARQVNLPLFQRSRADWRVKMASDPTATPTSSTAVPAPKKQKKQKDQDDEIDVLFKARGKDLPIMVVARANEDARAETEEQKKEAVVDDDMKAIYGALRASTTAGKGEKKDRKNKEKKKS